MDRRFFENYEDDLSKNDRVDFQKMDEEEYVLKENYMWSDEEDYSDGYIRSENDSEYKYSDSTKDTTSEYDSEYKCDYSSSTKCDSSEYDSECKCDYSTETKDSTAEDYCECKDDYSELSEDTSSECNCEYYNYEKEDCKNKGCTLEKEEFYGKYKKYYERGKKDGYESGYEAGARDAIKAAYKAGYKAGYRCALKRLGYRI